MFGQLSFIIYAIYILATDNEEDSINIHIEYIHVISIICGFLRATFTLGVFHSQLRVTLSLIIPVIRGMSSFLFIFFLYMILFAVINSKVDAIETT